MKLPSLRRPEGRELSTAIATFSSETAAVTEAPLPRHARATLYACSGMVALLLLLGAVSHIDRIVTSTGKVISVEPTLVVQPLETSIVRSIDVEIGQLVKKGQTLARLDPTFAVADTTQLGAQVNSLRAEIARLEGERDGREPVLPADVGPDNQALQAAIFKQRRAEYLAQLRSLDQKIAAADAGVTRSAQEAAQLRKRGQIATQVEQMRTELEKKEVGSKLSRLAANDAVIETTRALEVAEKTGAERQHELDALRASREVYAQQWAAQVVKDLVTKRDALATAEGQLQKAQRRKDLVELTADQDAVVLDVAKVSVGSVVKDAEKLFTLVPLRSDLEAEVSIDAADLGFVQPGDPVEVKFDAYRFLEHGTAKGTVRTISEDSFLQRADEKDAGKLVYRARVHFDEVKLRNVPANFRLVPGMPLAADIRVGRRTVLSYFTEGAMRNVHEAMREPQ